jgi:predicted aconitase with swiveling domain
MAMTPLVEGLAGRGELLKLDAPISFWGGVDPMTGAIIDARHPQRGQSVAGRVLALPSAIGSSSSSSVLLELVRGGKAPAAIWMVESDAILLLGLVVAKEMGWSGPPAARVSSAFFASLRQGCYAFDERGVTLGDAGDG